MTRPVAPQPDRASGRTGAAGIAGRAGKTIKTGRRIVYRRETPMCNLFLGMMDRMGVHTEHFGDSTGKIDGLDLT